MARTMVGVVLELSKHNKTTFSQYAAALTLDYTYCLETNTTRKSICHAQKEPNIEKCHDKLVSDYGGPLE